ncbi:enoyl-[acyl-carrier-protein] reductase [NADH] [Breoghania corrubedonensis]|uniref:Enoyl-[acyl-carrier-protein] reductase [NADH] n=1 Tax=Breoghania corrubedonensis TaxID=665038 RepID=A0A2T5US98_9HYPH|nr:enoyl-ACP reductase FabI [Breoghania corrubedonensis]PTW54378.1 enoyl-[acyl-carrier-protein] reductase [NADH] [Breoghania corrubedonensis]
MDTTPERNTPVYSLHGKKILVIGIANDKSIAWGCAKAYRALGAELAITYLNPKAETYVRPLAERLDAPIISKLDVTREGDMEATFEEIRSKWGRLDGLLHSIAFAPGADLHGRVIDCSREGFLQAMDVSCHSFIRAAKLAEDLMQGGGSIQTLSYLGADRVVDNYNLMGAAKAALESVARYLAAELGSKGITVNAISPGPLATRAASGIGHFDELLDKAAKRAPTGRLTTIDEVGSLSAFLMSQIAPSTTGDLFYVDGGYNIMA